MLFRSKAGKEFGVSDVTVIKCVKKLRSDSNLLLREKAMEIINRNKHKNKHKNVKLDPEAVVDHMYNNPGTYKEAAKLFGVSAASVRRCVKKLRSDSNLLLREKAMEIINRINRNKHKNAKLDPEAVVNHMYNNPVTYKEAAKLFGVSAGKVWYYVKKLADSKSSSDLCEKAMEDRKSTRLNSSHPTTSRMPSSA